MANLKKLDTKDFSPDRKLAMEEKMGDEKPKVTFENVIKCPHCGKKVVVKNVKTLTNEPVKAEYDEKVVVEKDRQQGLEDFKK